MRIELRDVTKGPAQARVLEPTTTAFASGTAVLVETETEQRPAVLGLIASGRMRPDAGTVLIDGHPDAKALRARTALVDAPDVCDPAPDVTVYGLVEEELMFAGRPSNLIAARRWLADSGFAHLGRLPISAVAPRERVSLLLELTALRRRVEAMVLVSPDRHGGDPREWWRIVEDFAARGYAMLVIAGRASALVLRSVDAAAEATPDDEPDLSAASPDADVQPSETATEEPNQPPEPPAEDAEDLGTAEDLGAADDPADDPDAEDSDETADDPAAEEAADAAAAEDPADDPEEESQAEEDER